MSEESTNTCRSQHRPLVWVMASSRPAVDECIRQLGSHERIERMAEFAFTSLSDDDVPSTRRIADAENLTAVLFVVECDSLVQERFRHWIQWSIKKVIQREDFRVFVCLQGLTAENLMQMASGSDPLIADLLDTVQIPMDAGYQVQISELATFINSLPKIRENITYRRWQSAITATTGTVACWVECLMAAVVLFCGTWVLMNSKVAMGWPKWALCCVALSSGVMFSTLTVITLYFLNRLSTWHQVMRERTSQIQVFLVAFFGPWTIGLTERIGAPISWLVLGIVLGVLLDYARRGGLQARKFREKIDPDRIAATGHALPSALATVAMGRPPDARKCHLFQQRSAHAFISYTRSSPWACQIAVELNQKLLAAGVDCFLDRNVLVDGSNWRAQLNYHLASANVFVGLLDQHSIQRRWPAAELEKALKCRCINALPDIILVVEPGTCADELTLPVFQCVLSGPKLNITESRPRVIEFGPRTLSVLTGAFEPIRYASTGALPLGILYFLRIVLLPVLFVMVALGTASSMIGLFAGLLVLAKWIWHGNLTPLLSGMTRSALGIMFAYLIGFSFRLIFSSRYEVITKNVRALVKANVIGAIGLILFLVIILRNAEALVLGWAFIATAIGWIMGADLLQCTRIGDPSKFRRAPE